MQFDAPNAFLGWAGPGSALNSRVIENGTVESLGARGEGVLKREGKVVFVPGVFPGEEIRFLHQKGRGRFDHGVLEAVIKPHPARRVTPCPYDHPGGCAGCQILALEHAANSELKRAALADALSALRVSPDLIQPTRIVDNGLAYRNRAHLLLGKRGKIAYPARKDGENANPGGRVFVDSCATLHPLLNDLLPLISGRLSGLHAVEIRAGITTGERLVILHGEEIPKRFDPAALDACSILRTEKNGDLPLKGMPEVHEIISRVRLRIGLDTDFLRNTAGAEAIAEIVSDCLPPITKQFWAVDLQTGVGLFSHTSLAHCQRLSAVDPSRDAANDWNANHAALNHTSHGRFLLTSALSYLQDLHALRERPDVVISSPGRTDEIREFAQSLGALRVPNILLASYKTKELAQVLNPLLVAGYEVVSVHPVEMAGGTPYLHSVVKLVLPNPAESMSKRKAEEWTLSPAARPGPRPRG